MTSLERWVSGGITFAAGAWLIAWSIQLGGPPAMKAMASGDHTPAAFVGLAVLLGVFGLALSARTLCLPDSVRAASPAAGDRPTARPARRGAIDLQEAR